MNFFIVRNGELVTPALNGSILKGVTRQSLLEIAPSLNLKAREEKLSFSQITKEIESGVVTEAFACGTAAVIHSIGEFLYQEKKTSSVKSIKLKENAPVAHKLLEHLKKIQRGEIEAPGKWIFKI